MDRAMTSPASAAPRFLTVAHPQSGASCPSFLSLPYAATRVDDYDSALAISFNMAAPTITKSLEPEINQK
jgi:hypothetical protein